MTAVKKPEEWHYQWRVFRNDDDRMLSAWLDPFTMEDFEGRDVLECGCGGGHHTAMVAAHAKSVTAIDINTAEIARERVAGRDNVELVEADLMNFDLGRTFDVVMCIGVIHHTDSPGIVFENLLRHCRPGGTVLIWTYSAEGNALVRFGLEPVRRVVLAHLPRGVVFGLSRLVTALIYPIVHTVYRLPFLRFLPYFDYFRTFRELSFTRNMLNVFDKMNAPQTRFTTRRTCDEWFNGSRFDPGTISIRRHDGVGWSLMGVRRPTA